MNFLWTSLALGVSTLLGIALGTVMKVLSHRTSDLVLAVAAGMMIGASVVGLILPALESTVPSALALAIVGVFAGAGGVNVLGLAFGNLLMGVAAFLSPFLLAFAGGAMLFIVSNEMIPETHHDHETSTTFALLAGFMLILLFGRIFA